MNDEDEPPKGVARWLIGCDESGTHGARYYGFGTLWMPWQRRGDFSELIRRVRDEHGYYNEVKWNSVRSRFQPFYDDLVEEFFRVPWLSFHCCVVEKAVVRKELHGGDYDLARRKHFGMLLRNKVSRCVHAHPGREQTFRVLVDPIHSRYSKADEAAHVICNNALAKVFGGKRPVDRVLTRDSRETPSIQLCDVLLGAVMAAWEGEVTSEAKLDAQGWIARHLGWPDLRADTSPSERKFNVWVFYDPTRGARRVVTRATHLVYPVSNRP